MPSVTITEQPQDLRSLLGNEAGLSESVLCQNLSATRTVYRLRNLSSTPPDPSGPAFRYRPGAIFRFGLLDRPYMTWVWTTRGEACLTVESDYPV